MQLKLKENSNGKEIELDIGQQFTVELQENPTTGYRWRLTSSGGPVCSIVSDFFVASSHHVGSAGVHEWLFHVVSRGSAAVEMRLAREWDQSVTSRSFLLKLRAT